MFASSLDFQSCFALFRGQEFLKSSVIVFPGSLQTLNEFYRLLAIE